MPWMTEEEYEFKEDCREKKDIARSAKSKRANCGRRGRVVFPSDKLTDSQRKALNGECKTYCMNKPMNWDIFISMPTDLQVEYIKTLRKKFDVPDFQIAYMLDVPIDILYEHYTSIKLRVNVPIDYDVEGWLNWKGENA